MVTTRPTAYDQKAVVHWKLSGDPLRSSPNVANSALMPRASTNPSPSPRVEPTTPTTKASNSTDRVTWRRDAPSARNSASSRLRWATRIENVLMMRKEPTNRAIPAKISRKVLMNDSALLMLFCDSLAAASPVIASKPRGSRAWTAFARSAWLVPFVAVTHASV